MDDLRLFGTVTQKWWLSILDKQKSTSATEDSKPTPPVRLTESDIDERTSAWEEAVRSREASKRREIEQRDKEDELRRRQDEASVAKCPLFRDMYRRLTILQGRINSLSFSRDPFQFSAQLEAYTEDVLEIQRDFRDMCRRTADDKLFRGQIRITNPKFAAFEEKVFSVKDEIGPRMEEFLEKWEDQNNPNCLYRREIMRIIKLLDSQRHIY